MYLPPIILPTVLDFIVAGLAVQVVSGLAAVAPLLSGQLQISVSLLFLRLVL